MPDLAHFSRYKANIQISYFQLILYHKWLSLVGNINKLYFLFVFLSALKLSLELRLLSMWKFFALDPNSNEHSVRDKVFFFVCLQETCISLSDSDV